MTTRLAQRAVLPAFCVLYSLSARRNLADPAKRDIERFRLKRTWPHPEPGWRTLTPKQYAEALLKIRAWSARKLDQKAANDERF